VPAEIGHAPYAVPLLRYLLDNFRQVRLVAVREKLFAELSEDVWLLFADGFGSDTGGIEFSAVERFVFQSEPPEPDCVVSRADWESWGFRLRPFLLPENARKLYRELVERGRGVRFGQIAKSRDRLRHGGQQFLSSQAFRGARRRDSTKLLEAVRQEREKVERAYANKSSASAMARR